MPNPIINALAEAQKSHIDTLNARAQFIDTLRSEQQKAAEKRMAKVQERALTVQQAKEQAAKDAQDQQKRAQESIMAVMPQPQVVRGDRPGIGQALATSSHGSIGGLENIIGATAGGPQPAQQTASDLVPGAPSGNPNDPLGVNSQNPIAGMRLGTDISMPAPGRYLETTRQPIQTGIKAVDLIHGAIMAASGRAPLSYTSTVERPDLAMNMYHLKQQEAQDAAAAAAQARDEARADVRLGFEQERLGMEKQRLALETKASSRASASQAAQLTAQYFNTEADRRQEFTKLSLPFITKREAIANILSQGKPIGTDKAGAPIYSKAGDKAIIYSFAKLADPGGRLSDQDIETLGRIGSLPDIAQNYFNIWVSGNLTPEIRNQIVGAGKTIFKEAEQQHLYLRDQFKAIAEREGLNPADVTLDFAPRIFDNKNIPNPPDGSPPGSRFLENRGGKNIFVGPDARRFTEE